MLPGPQCYALAGFEDLSLSKILTSLLDLWNVELTVWTVLAADCLICINSIMCSVILLCVHVTDLSNCRINMNYQQV